MVGRDGNHCIVIVVLILFVETMQSSHGYSRDESRKNNSEICNGEPNRFIAAHQRIHQISASTEVQNTEIGKILKSVK